MKNTDRTMYRQAMSVFCVAMCGVFLPGPAKAQEAPVTTAPVVVATDTNAAGEAISRNLAALQDAIEEMDDRNKPMVEPSARQNVIRSLSRLQRGLDNKDYRSALQTCDSLSAESSSQAFRKMIKDLSAAISLQTKADQARLAAEMRSLLASVPTVCAAATNQTDLQPLNLQVQQAQNALSRMSDTENPEISILRQNLQNAQEVIRLSMGCLAAESAGDSAKAIELMNQLMSMSSFSSFTSSPALKSKLERLQSAATEESSKVINAARAGMMKAATAREVRELSRDFNRQCSRVQRYSNNDPVIQQDLDSTRNALGAWARVLSAEERGDIQAALQALQGMDNDYYGRMDSQLQDMVTPKRNALFAKLLNQPAASDDALITLVSNQVAAVDSLDKLMELRRRLLPTLYVATSRMGYPTIQAEIQSLLADIQTLEAWRAALQAKQYGPLLSAQPSPATPLVYAYGPSASAHRWKALINRFQSQMRAQALAEMFDLKGLEVKEGQTPEQMLLQAADKAAGDKQWDTVAVYLDAYRAAAFGNQTPPASITDQIHACRQFIAAQNYEKAGDLARAAASYLAVLGAPAKRAPVEEAFKEIARLRKDHPDIFEKAQGASMTAP